MKMDISTSSDMENTTRRSMVCLNDLTVQTLVYLSCAKKTTNLIRFCFSRTKNTMYSVFVQVFYYAFIIISYCVIHRVSSVYVTLLLESIVEVLCKWSKRIAPREHWAFSI